MLASSLSIPTGLWSLLQRGFLLFAESLSSEGEEAISEAEKQMIWAAKKDQKHFKAIYETYFDRIFLYLHRRVKDEAIADDITSQTFYKALVNLHSFQFKGVKFSSWLYRIATNELNMYFRKNQSAVRHLSISSGALAELLKETEPEEEPEALNHLVDVLEKLSHEEIQLVEWRFYEDRSFKEIGFLLNITMDNAKTKTYRLLAKIKEMMPPK